MQSIKSFFTLTMVIFCLLGFALRVPAATIDVMIIYDTSAKSWVENNGGMTAFANDAVARLNQAAANSNINLTFRLAHTAETSYTYSKNLSTDLTNLQTGSGSLATVHQWRNNCGADLVVMMVDTGSDEGWVGQGYILESYAGDPDYAYTVNAIRAVAISHTLTHEIGHNLGCDHSKTQKDSPGPNLTLNSYSAGWYLTGTDAVKYHTIMAYGADGYGNLYTEAPLFSTPLLNYQGNAAGHAADGDNARTIRETMDVVAAYRVAVQKPLYAAFTNAGIWQWGGSGWTQLTPDNPESIVAAGSNLYGKFGNGIWQWTGSGWTHLTPDRPASMVASGTSLYGNFTGNGIWKWNGSGWTQLTPDNPESMVAAGTNLYGKFANGIWQWTGSGWTKLTPDSPASMVAAGTNLYGNFTGNGIWQWSGTSWSQLTPDNPDAMVAAVANLYGKFESGIWQWTGSGWTKLTPDSPASMAAAGSILYGTFTNNGIWQWSGTNWSQLTPDNPAIMAVGE